jgi:hypothetical protein
MHLIYEMNSVNVTLIISEDIFNENFNGKLRLGSFMMVKSLNMS